MAFINKIKIGNQIYDIILSQETIGKGLEFKNNKINVKLGSGLYIDENKNISIKNGLHMGVNDNGQIVFQPKLGPGLCVNKDGKICVKYDPNSFEIKNNQLQQKQII